VEKSYIKRIETILEPVAGAGNVRAQVTADLDFAQTEQMAESYKPNPAPGAAIRSQQTAESGTTSAAAAGVPGALSNQPPVPATAPITTPPVTGATQSGLQPLNINKNATINYEVDKTVKHTKGSPGTIKRLSVAVVVNNKKAPPDKEGRPRTVPLTAAEMKQINDLVHEAMGYSQERGDTLNVVNTSFSPSAIEKEVIPEIPLWKDPGNLPLARELLKYLVIFIVAFLLWRKLFKPLYLKLMEPPPAPEEEAEPTEEEGFEGLPDREKHLAYDAKLTAARELARDDPKLVSSIVRDWVGSANE
jgi:flagellar M-ring protein FliF